MAKLSEVVQGRIDSDTDFQTSIASLTDAEKAAKIAEKRAALIEEEGDKALTISSDQKTRAEKAEQERDLLKNDPRLKPADPVHKNEGDLSTEDMYLLASKQIHPEDVPEIKRLAQIGKDGKPMTISETLADSTAVAVIARRVELRATAAAADKGNGGRGGPGGDSDEQFRQKLAGGYIPAPGSADAEREFTLRRQNTGTGRQS